MKSDLDTIIIMDYTFHYLKRNEEGFFEKEIEIQSKPGENLKYGKPNGNNSGLSIFKNDVI